MKGRDQRIWTLLAMAIAPLIAVFLEMAMAVIAEPRVRGAPAGIFGWVALTYIEAWMFGIPAHLLLLKRGWTSGIAYCVGFMVAGFVSHLGLRIVVSIGAMMRMGASIPDVSLSAGSVVYVEMLFALVGVVFWLIARPDRTAGAV